MPGVGWPAFNVIEYALELNARAVALGFNRVAVTQAIS